ncbi:MAG: 4-(cytidine 5'-diphospho)-2-C-methyl-D-erythritol kinase [Verrucomicrobiota bacterium]
MSAPSTNQPSSMTLFSPAKINLMLSVHGRREDGFHRLTSLAVPLAFGDELSVRPAERADRLECADPAVPVGADNLILRAAKLFCRALPAPRYFEFKLEKRIPMGAGLGGGSSNAATALTAMNRLCGEPFDGRELRRIAAELGSDCAFFIDPRLALMRGRGERIDPLPPAQAGALEGRRLILFYPEFGVGTAWAYGDLAAHAPEFYEDEAAAERRLEAFERGGDLDALLFNSFEAAVGRKYRAIPALLSKLRDGGIACLMSGSGSACFALAPPEAARTARLKDCIRDAWGPDAFCVETSVLATDTSRIGLSER